MKRFCFVLAALVFVLESFAQNGNPLTVAEKSNYTSTSTYSDVMNFIGVVKRHSTNIRVENLATTTEGRDIPLLIVGNPVPKKPTDIGNRIAVYIQANIHAGEVEGKEATLMYVRDLLKNTNTEIFKNVVLLVCPIFNADGNERISTANRTNQNGPVNGVGVRHNSLYLDLNRDAMKVESHEIQGVISNVLNKWNPAIVMDCHTTNGSYHQEPVTFTWMMNPNGDRTLINYMRDRLMPQVSQTLGDKYNTLNCFYGEFVDQKDYDLGWVSYASEPRYFSNYVGLRNILGILNENYVYADFKSRVLGCYNLISSLMDYASSHKLEIMQLISDANNRNFNLGTQTNLVDSFAITYKGVPTPNEVTILTYEAEAYTDENGRERFRKTNRKRTVTIPYIADYVPTSSIAYPFAYILRVSDPAINSVLKIHGIAVDKLTDSVSIAVERFDIDSLIPELRLNQGHYTDKIYGKYTTVNMRFDAGALVIKTSQKFGRLAAYLLEPQSDDGLVYWNYFDRYLVPQWGPNYYPVPVYRIDNPVDLPLSKVDF